MPAITASYPGKIILLGEHAVVYHSHAIAIPINQVQSKATITPLLTAPAGTILVSAPNIQLDCSLDDLSENNPIGLVIRSSLNKLGVSTSLAFSIRISSSIPIAAGLGSGASVSCAIASAVSSFLGKPFTPQEVSDIAFDVEKLHHGTPSGVDNTVIAFNQPVYFQRGRDLQQQKVGKPMHFIIADTGIQASTADVVGAVREGRQADPEKYDGVIQQIDQLVMSAHEAISAGDLITTGQLMTSNHTLLNKLGVSHPVLDRLVDAALGSHALGAKLSGAGCGGNMIALTAAGDLPEVERSLMAAGAKQIFSTILEPTHV